MSTEWGRAVVQLRCRCADIFSALMAKAQTIGRNETRPRHRGVVSRQQAKTHNPRTITAK